MKWVWPVSFISVLFHESHHTTNTYSLSLSRFYTLHPNIMCCNPATELVIWNVFTFSTYSKMFHIWRNLSSKFQGYWTFAELAFSQLADIPSFIPQWHKFYCNILIEICANKVPPNWGTVENWKTSLHIRLKQPKFAFQLRFQIRIFAKSINRRHNYTALKSIQRNHIIGTQKTVYFK